jgi:AcrR family transcriptional regulator
MAIARAPKRERGKQRVAALSQAAAVVFAERGFEAATMTEIAARAGAPIGSLYQFFPNKEALADLLVQHYLTLIKADLDALESHAEALTAEDLVGRLFDLLRGHPHERAAALPLAEARMDEKQRRVVFRHMLRRRIAAILLLRAPALTADAARDMAVVLLQLMKTSNALSDEESLPGRVAGLRDLKGLALHYLEQRLPGYG